jgi:hypothetical protein
MRDKKKQQLWIKEHYDTIKGFRPICSFNVLSANMHDINLTVQDFVYDGSIKQPFRLWGVHFRVHVPRSLLKRAKIQVDKVTRQIKGTSAMHSANK